jgi:uncharacterized protein (DUF1810 family)
MLDPYAHFLEAQVPVYERVLAELAAGDKRSHWMWFIFPQLAGLGSSSMAARYALASLAEAKAYADHPVLGERLRECTRRVNAVQGRSIQHIFGEPDWLKFRSSMTLFFRATGDPVFAEALRRYYGGEEDERTLALLG